MTTTRRQTPTGAAAMTAAAALPALAAADVAMVDSRHRFRDVVAVCAGRKWSDWFGRYDFIKTVRAPGETELIEDCDSLNFRETA
jgi:hypothetical protein